MDNNDFYYSSVPKETLDARNKFITERWAIIPTPAIVRYGAA